MRAMRPKVFASKKRHGKGMKNNKTMQGCLLLAFIFLTVISSAAQLPTGTSAATTSNQSSSQPLTSAQTPSLDAFSGSGAVDKLVPGVVPLSLLDAMDCG